MSNYSVRDRIEEAMTLVHSAVHVGHITLSTNKRFRDFLDNIHAQVEKGRKLLMSQKTKRKYQSSPVNPFSGRQRSRVRFFSPNIWAPPYFSSVTTVGVES